MGDAAASELVGIETGAARRAIPASVDEGERVEGVGIDGVQDPAGPRLAPTSGNIPGKKKTKKKNKLLYYLPGQEVEGGRQMGFTPALGMVVVVEWQVVGIVVVISSVLLLLVVE